MLLVMGKTDPNNKDTYKQQSVVIVPLPHPGVKILGYTSVFGYDVVSPLLLTTGRTTWPRRDRLRQCPGFSTEHGIG
jgi:hypothetical protein